MYVTNNIRFDLRKIKEQHDRKQLNVIEESLESNHFWENWNTPNKQQQKELSIQNRDVWINPISPTNLEHITKNQKQKHIHDHLLNLKSVIKDYQNPLESPNTLEWLQDQI